MCKSRHFYVSSYFVGLINGIASRGNHRAKYSNVDFQQKTIHIQGQVGKVPAINSEKLAPKTITKQEIALKTPNSNRILKLPDVVF